MSWKNVYSEAMFSINTQQPSAVARSALARTFHRKGSVLDLGCGNGRNAVFAARECCIVDAVDTEYLGFLEGLESDVKKRIRFHEQDVRDFSMEPEKYIAVFAIRLIQYLPWGSVVELLEYSAETLTSMGFLALSYTASGGIFELPEVDVEKFVHPVDEVRNAIEQAGLDIVLLQPGVQMSTHAPYKKLAETYDILATKSLGVYDSLASRQPLQIPRQTFYLS